MGVNYTLSSVLERQALDPRTGGKNAFTMGAQARTFAALHDQSRRLAQALLQLGVAKGDRVAILMGNRLEWIECLFAATSIGAVCLPVNVLLTGNDVNAVLEHAAPRVLIVDQHAQPALSAMTAMPETVVSVGSVDAPSACRRYDYTELCASRTAETPDVAVSPTDPAMMYYTSGTTGAPKAAVHTHQGVLWNTLHQVSDLELSADETYLVVPSFSWSAGLHHITLAQMWAGGRSEILPTGARTLQRIVDTVEQAGITHAFIAPTLLKELLGSPELLGRLRESPLTRVMSGAEPLPASVTDPLHEALPSLSITQAYGMTEMPLIAAFIRPSEGRSHPGSTGRASSITTLGVRRPDGTVAFEGDGEIVLRSPATTVGYLDRADENEVTFRDGWFHTGDSGHLDAEGFLSVTGRTKDMIITGGINISPSEIEDVIHECPGVAEVAVVGVSDARWGEVPVAVVVARTTDSVTEQEIADRCAAALSKYKRPRQIRISTRPLPKTITGKILKRELRQSLNRGA
ncbi:acyl--CoA ligase [Streptomyces sp. RS2]|uniref:class I adenylate-forming enzyme family protein n=1 Tax=Streptomyces sp. RS2 TaxID=1451205 RepID=UPI0021F878E7|nr:class I adenylate-forming enzyme family protein [Streptomyces sp. RS2]MCW1100206.1 acyl--CoA ligase [Streptomyces sp. RS2]